MQDAPPPPVFRKLHLVLAFALLVFAAILQSHIALGLSLWGDEMDTIECVLAPWRGSHGFWWRVSQNIATPPGEALVLRLFLKSGLFSWIQASSPELFWRLPYIATYLATAATGGALTLRWTRSSFTGFACFVLLLCAAGPLIYATEARYYIWLCFFMTLSLWNFMILLEKGRTFRHFALVSLSIAVGVCFHVALAALAYLFLAYSFYYVIKRRIYARGLPILISGLAPLLLYKVELKYLLWMPPKTVPLHFFTVLAELTPAFCSTYLLPFLPFPRAWPGGGLSIIALFFLTLGAVGIYAYKKLYDRSIQGLILLAMVGGCTTALLVSAATRGYSLIGRHFIFFVPVALCMVCYLLLFLAHELKLQSLCALCPRMSRFGGTVLSLALSVLAFTSLNSDLRALEHSSPAKVNYPFAQWKAFYTALPDRRPLVIVGADPTRNETDDGGYLGRMHERYAVEFSPLYLSKFGFYGPDKKPRTQKEADEVIRFPQRYDFLRVGGLATLQNRFNKAPRVAWTCHDFPGGPVSFCRAGSP